MSLHNAIVDSVSGGLTALPALGWALCTVLPTCSWRWLFSKWLPTLKHMVPGSWPLKIIPCPPNYSPCQPAHSLYNVYWAPSLCLALFSSCFHRAYNLMRENQLTNTACAGQSVFATPHSFPPCSVPRRLTSTCCFTWASLTIEFLMGLSSEGNLSRGMWEVRMRQKVFVPWPPPASMVIWQWLCSST